MMGPLSPSSRLCLFFLFVLGINVCWSFKSTRINSPNYPSPYPSDDIQQWTVVTPAGNQTLIIVNELNIEEPWDTLTITHTSPALPVPFTSHLRTGVKGFLFKDDGITNISFCSDTRRELTGFDLEVITMDITDQDDVTVTERAGNLSHWCSAEHHQFIASDAQCNGVFECANYTDDAECFDEEFGRECGPGFHQCMASPELCVSQERVCDGWNDCPLGDDEENCGKNFDVIDYGINIRHR
nr:suppressor of tumorigenicity 14 protein-like [Lytechinus pictus]